MCFFFGAPPPRQVKYPPREIPRGLPGVDLGEGDDDAGQEVVVLAQRGGKCLGVRFGFCEEADSIDGLVLYCRRSDKDRLLISTGKSCCQRIRTGAILECTYLHGKNGAPWRPRDGGRSDRWFRCRFLYGRFRDETAVSYGKRNNLRPLCGSERKFRTHCKGFLMLLVDRCLRPSCPRLG